MYQILLLPFLHFSLDVQQAILLCIVFRHKNQVLHKILNYLLDLILDEPELNNREFLLEKTRNFLDSNNINNAA